MARRHRVANFGSRLTIQAHQQNEYTELPLLLESYEHLSVLLKGVDLDSESGAPLGLRGAPLFTSGH